MKPHIKLQTDTHNKVKKKKEGSLKIAPLQITKAKNRQASKITTTQYSAFSPFLSKPNFSYLLEVGCWVSSNVKVQKLPVP